MSCRDRCETGSPGAPGCSATTTATSQTSPEPIPIHAAWLCSHCRCPARHHRSGDRKRERSENALRHLLGGYPGEETDVDAVIGCGGRWGASQAVSGGLVVANEGPWVRIGSVPSPAGPVTVVQVDDSQWEERPTAC